MAQGGISMLSLTAANAEDPQTLRMVAGAIANLCGNGKCVTSLMFNFSNFINFTCYNVYESFHGFTCEAKTHRLN